MVQVIDLERASPRDPRPLAGALGARGEAGRLLALVAGRQRFLRFCCVGGVGFCVDALALLWFIHAAGVDPIPARLLSAVVGIITTFELNRRWAFRGAGAQSYGAALAVYVGVQGLGLGCNMAVYTACYLLLPRPIDAPLVCLAVASGTAMLLNYAGASRLVFRATPP